MLRAPKSNSFQFSNDSVLNLNLQNGSSHISYFLKINPCTWCMSWKCSSALNLYVSMFDELQKSVFCKCKSCKQLWKALFICLNSYWNGMKSTLLFCRWRNSVWRLMLPGQTRLSLEYLSHCTMRVCVQTAENLSPSSFSPPGQCCRTSWLSHWCPMGMLRSISPSSVDARSIQKQRGCFTWINLGFVSLVGASLSKLSLQLSARRAWMQRKHDRGLNSLSFACVFCFVLFSCRVF